MNNKIISMRNLSLCLSSVIIVLLSGCISDVLVYEDEHKNEISVDTISKSKVPIDGYSYNGENNPQSDTVKVTVGFDAEYKDTITIDM